MISRSRRLSCVFVSLDIADPQRLDAKKLALTAKKVALGGFLSSEAVADVPGLPEMPAVGGQDEVEVGAQPHTQQAGKRGWLAGHPQMQAAGLAHSAPRLIADP